MRRSQDTNVEIWDCGGEFLVECPKCRRCAVVLSQSPDVQVRLTCGSCGLAKPFVQSSPGVAYSSRQSHYKAGEITIGAPVDWYFHLPLWLRARCCGEELWAYNMSHLTLLETFVSSLLRERRPWAYGWHNKSLRGRLPKWMQAARNRQEILRAIGKLKLRAEERNR